MHIFDIADIDLCSTNPCGEKSTCTPLDIGIVICTCKPGFKRFGNRPSDCKPECETNSDCPCYQQCLKGICKKGNLNNIFLVGNS